MSYKLISSPLQGFTDYRFRNAFHEIFGGVDIYYAPYIKFFNKLEIKSSYQRDLQLENNKVPKLIPQVMTNSVEEFLFTANYVESLGYTELNWNLGCPYPMATKRGMGAGLIHNPELIDAILDEVHRKSNITVSMKMRLGHESPTEILNVMPILAKYPIKSIAIHARLGKQLYKGGVDLDSFQNALDHTEQTVCYNGDITSVERFTMMKERFPSVHHFLIGRGLISDPFLPQMIQQNRTDYPENRVALLGEFHDVLFHQYDEALSGSSHLVSKMLNFWEYYSNAFENPQKTFKKIKKAKNIIKYKVAVKEILNAEQ
tara:strand:+ start:4873 stop:5820 length:948 start_codon:yes stop_codon:yes gene_type:complete